MKSSYTLVIVESPAKAKTIEKYLGSTYRVMSSIGHVRDLPKSNNDAVDIEAGFVPKYIISPGKEKVIQSLKSAAKNADRVLLASDPDREGEAIAWHVAELIKEANPNQERVVFNEITEDAIKEAILHPRPIDINLKEAQEARRVLDRLVGYDLSGLIWKKVRYGLSAGRVQSPALRIVMERERDIRAFIPEDYFVLSTNATSEGYVFPLTCSQEPKTKSEATRIKNTGELSSWMIRDCKETEVKRSAKAPFTTSTLQQTASTRLGFSPSRTMSAAQKLYENGHITYMRTDSTTISVVAQKQIISYIKKTYSENYLAPRQFKTKSKSAQEAHEAIRPTVITTKSAGMNADQKTLYELIWRRTVSSQMSDAVIARTKISANCTHDTDNIPDFTTTGSRILFDGWLRVDTASRSEDVEIPKLPIGTPITIDEITIDAKQTQPPSRYSEAGLIKELEKRGIGRPSTYASIMNTIIERGYVNKDGRTLFPTETGDVVSTFLEQQFAEYISDTFTSEMENELDEIAIGVRNYRKTLTDFYEPFHQVVVAKETIPKLTDLGPGPTQFPCPLCGGEMVIKLGKSGTFLSCNRFPDCNGSRLIDGSELTPDEPIGKHPETNEDIFVMKGKYGPYVQLGQTPEKIKGKGKSKKTPSPRRASLPNGIKPEDVTIADAVKYLLLPRELGKHPDTGEPVVANTGQYGPYIAHAGDFRSLKSPDDPYEIDFDRAMQILTQPKQGRKGETLLKVVGIHPKTRKMITIYESKSGRYFRRGFKRIPIPNEIKTDDITIETALAILKS
jgi:DNA topoisomerase I